MPSRDALSGMTELDVMKQAFLHAPVGFAVLDEHLCVVRTNDALAEMSGVPTHALAGKKLLDVLPFLAGGVAESLEHVLHSGLSVRDVEVSGFQLASSGERRTWLTSQYPLRDTRQRVVGVTLAASDITERRRAETLHREQAELLALANETVIVRSPDGTITSWNQAAEDMYGYPASEAVGRNIHELLRTQFPNSREAVHAAILSDGFWQGELRHLRRNDVEMHVLSRQALQRDAHGEAKAILEVNWDITARMRAQQALQRLNETLERRVAARTAALSRVNEELEAFTYTVAHDLRTPLRSVHGFAEAVLEDYAALLDDDGRNMLRRIAVGAERMDGLIHDLLEYSRLSRSDISVEAISLGEVFEMAVTQLQPDLTARSAVVHVEVPLPVVVAHPGTLAQIVMNLLSNAVKFVPSGVTPRVRVWAERTGDRVRTFVQDNGIGIEERHRERIWRVFERLHTIEEYPGTGVGLAIVKKSAERMNGTVGVSANSEGGSRFWFELPLAPRDQEARQ